MRLSVFLSLMEWVTNGPSANAHEFPTRKAIIGADSRWFLSARPVFLSGLFGRRWAQRNI